MNESNLTPKQELEKILTTTDITKVDRIEFFPTNGTMFASKNENIMKLAVYISASLGKKTFEPGELKGAFEFVISNLDSHLPREEFTSIANALLAFIHSGGRIDIIEKGLLASTLDDTKKAPKESIVQNSIPPSHSNIGNQQQAQSLNSNQQVHSTPYLTTYPNQKEKVMTWKNVLMGSFVLSPIAAIITGVILGPLRVILRIAGSTDIVNSIIGIISLILTPIIWVLLSERILKLSRKGSIVLFVVISLIGIGIFAAVCGGIILIFFR